MISVPSKSPTKIQKYEHHTDINASPLQSQEEDNTEGEGEGGVVNPQVVEYARQVSRQTSNRVIELQPLGLGRMTSVESHEFSRPNSKKNVSHQPQNNSIDGFLVGNVTKQISVSAKSAVSRRSTRSERNECWSKKELIETQEQRDLRKDKQ